jgi:acyl dehydratase
VQTVADLSLEELHVGLKADLVWLVTNEEIDRFAASSGDCNPMHIDADYARTCGFQDRLAHGFLLGSKISAFIGTVIPGRRCLLVEEMLSFPNPIYPGDKIVIAGEVIERWPDLRLIKLKIRANKQADAKSVTVGRGNIVCRIQS